MPSLDLQCISVFNLILQSTTDDTHWRAFGYRRRPRRGKLFKSLVPSDKLQAETTLLQNFWSTSFSEVFYWAFNRPVFQFKIHFIARLMDLCVDGLDKPLWPTLRFRSASAAIDYLCDACKIYCTENHAEHPGIFLQRCASQLNGKFPDKWVLGSAWLFTHPDSLLSDNLFFVLEKTGIADNEQLDLNIRKNIYIDIAQEIFS